MNSPCALFDMCCGDLECECVVFVPGSNRFWVRQTRSQQAKSRNFSLRIQRTGFGAGAEKHNKQKENIPRYCEEHSTVSGRGISVLISCVSGCKIDAEDS